MRLCAFTPRLINKRRDAGKYRIASARKVGWDYSSASPDFITMDAGAQSPPFGARREGEMFRNDLGESVAHNWVLAGDECVGVAFDGWQPRDVAGCWRRMWQTWG